MGIAGFEAGRLGGGHAIAGGVEPRGRDGRREACAERVRELGVLPDERVDVEPRARQVEHGIRALEDVAPVGLDVVRARDDEPEPDDGNPSRAARLPGCGPRAPPTARQGRRGARGMRPAPVRHRSRPRGSGRRPRRARRRGGARARPARAPRAPTHPEGSRWPGRRRRRAPARRGRGRPRPGRRPRRRSDGGRLRATRRRRPLPAWRRCAPSASRAARATHRSSAPGSVAPGSAAAAIPSTNA